MNFKHQGIISGLLLTADLVVAETEIPFPDLPVPVQSAAKKQLHAARIIGASSEKEEGRAIYEVETTVGGKSRDLSFDRAGKLLEVEEQVDLENHSSRSQGGARREIRRRNDPEGGIDNGRRFGELRSDRHDEKRQAQ